MKFNIFGINKNKLSIVDKEDNKEFRYGIITYSRIYKNSIYTGSYWDFFLPLPALYKNPKVLIIGLGGGTIPYQMQETYKDIEISVSEIDKRAIELAKEFLPKINFRIINEDGLKLVKNSINKFDVIVLDAYIKDYIPRGFLGKEFIDDSYIALTGKGILAINFALSLKNLIHMNSYILKLKERYGVYKLISSHLFGNMILICSKSMNKQQINDLIKYNFNKNERNDFIVQSYNDMVPV